jgi:DNA-directed RNA polymerase subunit M/transcription elongation factor TFIIS
MEIKVYCPKCRAVLLVPLSAAGKVARCPTCSSKFQVPGQKDVMDETVSSWIEQDVEDMQDEFDQLLVEKSAGEQRRREEREKAKASIAAAKMDRALKQRERMLQSVQNRDTQKQGPATITRPGAPVTQQSASTSTEPAIDTPSTGRLESPTSGQAPTIAPGAPAPAPEPEPSIELAPQYSMPEEEDVIDESLEYPMTVFVDKTYPNLVVAEVSQRGVLMAFDSSFLEHTGFRLSFPTQCVFSGHNVYHELVAKPLGFFDQSQGEIRNAQEIENRREITLVSDMTPRRAMGLMGSIDQLPTPFKFPMPYYVSIDHVTMSMECSTAKRGDGGGTCYVLVPTGGVALQWLQNVNGICGDDVRLLRRDVSFMWSDQWQQLPEHIRHRLSTWVAFEGGEHFQYYFNDAEFGKKDEGLAGVVLTDRRLIYHKYHRKGSVRYGENPKLILSPDGDFAGLTVQTLDGSSKAALFRFTDLEMLMQNMRDAGLDVELHKG